MQENEIPLLPQYSLNPFTNESIIFTRNVKYECENDD